jgi:hypothetical protein
METAEERFLLIVPEGLCGRSVKGYRKAERVLW